MLKICLKFDKKYNVNRKKEIQAAHSFLIDIFRAEKERSRHESMNN